jgi:Zn-dependent M28 family amino/carboxypeptidase
MPFHSAPDVLQTVLESHIRRLEGVRHPLAAPAALERAADFIAKTFREFGYAPEVHPVPVHGREFRNLIATRPGRSPERVLVIAHYDTVEISPGADDNASGVAVLLELARLFQTTRPERTLQFVAVALEEPESMARPGVHSLRGSRALAAHARNRGWKIAGAVVLESVAYADDAIPQNVPDGTPVATPERGDFLAVVGNEASQGLVEAFIDATARRGVPLPCVPLVVPGRGESLPDTRRSDHASFWDRGYPAIMLTDTANFRNPHYHAETDTLETLNLEFAARVCRATAALVAKTAGCALPDVHPVLS